VKIKLDGIGCLYDYSSELQVAVGLGFEIGIISGNLGKRTLRPVTDIGIEIVPEQSTYRGLKLLSTIRGARSPW
jgi:hypothetical protein